MRHKLKRFLQKNRLLVILKVVRDGCDKGHLVTKLKLKNVEIIKVTFKKSKFLQNNLQSSLQIDQLKEIILGIQVLDSYPDNL